MPYKVKKAQIAPLLEVSFPEYAGRKFFAEFASIYRFYNTYWDGGTKNEYKVINMDNGETSGIPVTCAPWDIYEGLAVSIPENIVIVRHSYFCGKDVGITFYAHPSRQQEFQKLGGYGAELGVTR